jgi:hypothetical protein
MLYTTECESSSVVYTAITHRASAYMSAYNRQRERLHMIILGYKLQQLHLYLAHSEAVGGQ